MKKINGISTGMAFVVMVSMSLVAIPAVLGAVYTWDADGVLPLNDGAGSWAASANWYNGATYGAWGNTTADTAIIGVGSGAAGTITQSGTNTLNTLTFNAPGSGSNAVNQSVVAGANILSFGGTAPAINVNSSATIEQGIDDSIEFAASTLTVNIASNQALTTRKIRGATANSTVTVTGGGTLRLLADAANMFLNYSIASGSVLNLDGARVNPLGTNTISGGGTLRISGGVMSSTFPLRLRIVNLSLGSGGLIDVQSGAKFQNGGYANMGFASNLSDLNVDGTFDVWDGETVYVDALTGTGVVTKAEQWTDVTLVVGIDNGSGTFAGSITTNAAAQAKVMNLTKTGTGTQTLSGSSIYNGVTTVDNGVLRLAAGASLNPATTVYITSPGKLDLDGSINQTVNQLLLDGIPAASGTWGSTSSAADNKSDVYFQGTGIVTVLVGPKLYTWDADGVAPLNDGAGSWVSSGGSNWFNGVTYGPWGNTVTNVAVVGVSNGAAGTITQSGTITLNGLIINAPGSSNYTIDQSAVAGTNILSFGGTGPSIIVNNSATIAQTSGSGDYISLAAGTLTMNIASNQTLTLRKLVPVDQNSSVIVTGGGTLSLLHEDYNKFIEGINGNGSATLFIKNNSTVRLAEAFHCISDLVRVDIAAGSTFDHNGRSEGVGYISGAGNWTNSVASLSGLTLDIPTYFNGANFSGVMSGSIDLTIRGNGGSNTQILSGTNNSYTGKTVIMKGVLQVMSVKSVGAGNSSLGAPTSVANGTIVLGDSANTGTLKYAGAGDTSDRVLNLAGTTSGGVIDQSGTGLLKFTSAMTATGAGAKTLTLQGSTAGTGELAGAITNSAGGAISLLKTGTGAWILSGANSFTGTTTIYPGAGYNGTNETLILANLSGAAVQGNVIVDGSGGAVAGCAVLKMGAPNQFGANSVLVLTNVTLPRQSVVKLMGYDQTIAGLSAAALSNGQAIVENTENESNVVAEVTLTISNSTNYTYAGILRDTVAGVGKISIVKTGTGTQTFGGTGFLYTGDTTISNGVLSLTNGATLSTSSVVRVRAPGKMELGTGVNPTVRELWLEGRQKARGTWGAPGSGAQREDDHFLGGGTLRVTTGVSDGGMIIIQ